MSGDDQIDRTLEDAKWRDEFCSPALMPDMGTSVTAAAFKAFIGARRTGQRTHFVAGNRSGIPTTPHCRNKQAESSDSLPTSEDNGKRDGKKTISDYQAAVCIITKLADNATMEWGIYGAHLDDNPDGRNDLAGAFCGCRSRHCGNGQQYR